MIAPLARFALTAGAALGLAFAAACGGGGDERVAGDGTPAPDTSPTPTTPAATAEPTTTAVPTATEAPPTATPAPQVDTFGYVVEPGDTLSGIADDFGVSTDAVLAANPDVEPRALRVGMTVRVPVADGGPSLPDAPFEYVVEPGDTLSGIAALFDVSLDGIFALNPGVDPRALAVGSTVVVPGAEGVPAPTATPDSDDDGQAVTGLLMPISGACLPSSDNLMPNAPRDYRNGIHEGVDFWPGYSCATIQRGTPVRAAASGTVTVATLDYQPLTQEEWEAIRRRSQEAGRTLPDDLFRLRGRQVEIAHGDGIATRYAHLSSIAEGIRPGARIEQGQVIGYVGNSGTPSGIDDPSASVHLHFEVRVGDSYLGAGLPANEVRTLYQQAFR